MEYIYNAYLKEIDGKKFYFVKKLSSFPEFADCPPLLVSMGMHSDFFKACDIANVYDQDIISKLMEYLHVIPDSTKVIHLKKVKHLSSSLIKNTQQVILKLKLAAIS